LAVFTAGLLVWGCASVQAPPGGPKDESAPELLRTVPTTGSKNYKGKVIELFFNEPVQLENLYKQLLVTPYIEPKFSSRTKQDRVIIEFENDFSDSTTYTINFREGVVDITEKNVAENVKLAFSTGPFIDSMSVKGQVRELMTGLPAEDVTVMLYRPEDTISVQKPYYLTKSDEEGFYILENLRVGTYKLFAVQEEDNDLAYNKDEEMVAFLDQNIVLDSNINQMNLKIAEYDNTPFKFTRTQASAQYVEITYSKNIEDYKLTFLEPTYRDSIYHMAVEDYIKLYDLRKKEEKENEEQKKQDKSEKKRQKNQQSEDPVEQEEVAQDSIVVIAEVFDQSENYLRDTVKFLFSNRRTVDPEGFSMTVKPSSGTKMERGNVFDASIELSKPALVYNLDEIQLLKLKDTTLTTYDTLYEVIQVDTLPIAIDSSYLVPIAEEETGQDTENQLVETESDTLLLSLNSSYTIDPTILGDDISVLIQPDDVNRKKGAEQLSLTPETVTFRIKTYDLTDYQLDTLYNATQVVDTMPLPYTLELNDNFTELTISDVTYAPTERLLIDSLAFVSVEYDTTKQKIIEYKMKQADKYGVIAGSVITDYENFTLQLLDNQYKVEQEIENQLSFRFEYVEPGEKFLRILVDRNNDGEWSKGDVEERIMPEPVFLREGSIEVKPNWEILGEVITTEPNLSTNQQDNSGK